MARTRPLPPGTGRPQKSPGLPPLTCSLMPFVTLHKDTVSAASSATPIPGEASTPAPDVKAPPRGQTGPRSPHLCSAVLCLPACLLQKGFDMETQAVRLLRTGFTCYFSLPREMAVKRSVWGEADLAPRVQPAHRSVSCHRFPVVKMGVATPPWQDRLQR